MCAIVFWVACWRPRKLQGQWCRVPWIRAVANQLMLPVRHEWVVSARRWGGSCVEILWGDDEWIGSARNVRLIDWVWPGHIWSMLLCWSLFGHKGGGRFAWLFTLWWTCIFRLSFHTRVDPHSIYSFICRLGELFVFFVWCGWFDWWSSIKRTPPLQSTTTKRRECRRLESKGPGRSDWSFHLNWASAYRLELTIAECSTPLGQSCLCMECFPCRHVLHNDVSLAISPRGFTWNGLGGPTVDRWFQGLCDGGMGAGIDV